MFDGEQYYYGEDFDKYLYDNPSLIIFFAAGNSKESAPTMTLTRQATIKNVVSVGAGNDVTALTVSYTEIPYFQTIGESTFTSTNVDYVAYFSSNGPTYDGRMKPDIVAPGAAITSASSNGDGGRSCNLVDKQGTSMASPGSWNLCYRGAS